MTIRETAGATGRGPMALRVLRALAQSAPAGELAEAETISLELLFAWFAARLPAPNLVGFTVEQGVGEGELFYAQGLIDHETGEIVSLRQIRGRRRDGDVARLHAGQAAVIYT